MELELLYKIFTDSAGVSTDTRKVTTDCIYFALKGASFNGNNFAQKAFDNGAKYCVLDQQDALINDQCILVDDVLTTLQKLANYHRSIVDIPIIALTGSNGKTTTKELIYSVLAAKYNVSATIGNLNNHIGVPLTLLSFNSALNFGIVEMGANHRKEIEFLCRIAEPNYGLITNFGKAHLEGFGGVEGVIKGKSEMYDYLKKNNRKAFINTDDHKQLKQIGEYNNIYNFGKRQTNDCIVEFKHADPFVVIDYMNLNIKSQLIGDYNFGNIAVAIAIGQYFNVSPKTIKNSIEGYKPDNNRSEIINKGTTKIILDAYNANPTSMLAALKNLVQLNTKHKYLFLGDMFELGNEAKQEHQTIVDFAEANFSKHIILVGQNFFKTKTKASTSQYESFEDLQPELKKLNLENATVLIKGSRGMALERILEFI